MAISGTAGGFSLATRISPSLIAWCMGRLKSDSQFTRRQEVCQLEDPTLFAPSSRVFGVHGPFGERARRRSVQLWFDRCVSRVLDVFKPRQSPNARSAVLLPSKPVPTGPHQEPADLVLHTGDL